MSRDETRRVILMQALPPTTILRQVTGGKAL